MVSIDAGEVIAPSDSPAKGAGRRRSRVLVQKPQVKCGFCSYVSSICLFFHNSSQKQFSFVGLMVCSFGRTVVINARVACPPDVLNTPYKEGGVPEL